MADKIRLALLGTGGIAQRAHIPAWQSLPEVEIVALAEPVPARRQQALALLGDPTGERIRAFPHFEPLLETVPVDLVDITIPPWPGQRGGHPPGPPGRLPRHLPEALHPRPGDRRRPDPAGPGARVPPLHQPAGPLRPGLRPGPRVDRLWPAGAATHHPALGRLPQPGARPVAGLFGPQFRSRSLLGRAGAPAGLRLAQAADRPRPLSSGRLAGLRRGAGRPDLG